MKMEPAMMSFIMSFKMADKKDNFKYWEIKLLVVRVQELIRKFKKCFFSGRVKLKLSSGPYDF